MCLAYHDHMVEALASDGDQSPARHNSPALHSALTETPFILPSRCRSLDLIRAGADVEVRETLESALALGAAALKKLGTDAAEVADITARIRARDEERHQLELVGGIDAGKALFSGRRTALKKAVPDETPK
jgi:voltage-gated potassium channel Kch